MGELVLAGTAGLITGGGSGIGLAAARHLLRDGASVTLAGRSQERLDAAVAELRAEAPDGAEVRERRVRRGPGGRRRPRRRGGQGGHRRPPALRGVGRHRHRRSGGGPAGVGVGPGDGHQPARRLLHAEARRRRDGRRPGAARSSGCRRSPGRSPIRSCRRTACRRPGSRRWCATPPTSSAAATCGSTPCGRASCPPSWPPRSSRIPAVLADYLANMPISRTGTVDDVAHLIRFLCGPESSWITGQCISIDGGHTLRRGPNVEAWARAVYGDDGHRRHRPDPLTWASASGSHWPCLSSLPTGR